MSDLQAFCYKIVGKLVDFSSQCLLYEYVNVIASLSELDEGLR